MGCCMKPFELDRMALGAADTLRLVEQYLIVH